MGSVTEELLELGMSSRGGWSREQFAILKIQWPPVKGWKARVIGTLIRQEDADRFVELKDAHLPAECSP